MTSISLKGITTLQGYNTNTIVRKLRNISPTKILEGARGNHSVSVVPGQFLQLLGAHRGAGQPDTAGGAVPTVAVPQLLFSSSQPR